MARKGDRSAEVIRGDKQHAWSFGTLHVGFLTWLRDRNYSAATVSQRRRHLNELIVWAEERDLTRPTDLTRSILERYQRHLANRPGQRTGKPLSFRQQYAHLCAVRAWFRWLLRQQQILHNPAAELELPKLSAPLPRHILSATEVDDVLRQTDLLSPLALRDRAILETFYSTGIRRAELVGLHLYDVDLERGVLAIRLGKGRKDRMVPIGPRALAWLEKYRQEARPRLLVRENETVLFLTRYGAAFSKNSMTKLVSGYIASAELGVTGSCHLFRHALATSMLDHDADTRFIQAMLGHANLNTTQIYTRVSVTKLKEVHDRTHPS
jgi:integrase/recombinase XerD